ncbi:MAG: hypothetical protein AAF570_04855 [Bacteroidota bacterium]
MEQANPTDPSQHEIARENLMQMFLSPQEEVCHTGAMLAKGAGLAGEFRELWCVLYELAMQRYDWEPDNSVEIRELVVSEVGAEMAPRMEEMERTQMRRNLMEWTAIVAMGTSLSRYRLAFWTYMRTGKGGYEALKLGSEPDPVFTRRFMPEGVLIMEGLRDIPRMLLGSPEVHEIRWTYGCTPHQIEALNSLPNLRVVNLSVPGLREDQIDFRHVQQLEELRIIGLRLTRFPETLLENRALQSLEMVGCMLSSLRLGPGSLPSLQKLCIHRNSIMLVPKLEPTFPNLEEIWLDLLRNMNWKLSLRRVMALPRLRKIVFMKNHFHQPPLNFVRKNRPEVELFHWHKNHIRPA